MPAPADALAPATRDSYRNGWKKWEAFAREHAAPPRFPPDPEALAAGAEVRVSLLASGIHVMPAQCFGG